MYYGQFYLFIANFFQSNRFQGPLSFYLIRFNQMIVQIILFHMILEVQLYQQPIEVHFFSFFNQSFIEQKFSFLFDLLTVSMLIPILFVGSQVIQYSFIYMENDPHQMRFLSYQSLFIFFMLFLVGGDNYFMILIGWEGVGLVSYQLINFWYTRLVANYAAFKAIMMNKIGDYGFLVGIIITYSQIQDFNIASSIAILPEINSTWLLFQGLGFYLACVAKSAQFGLHHWLSMAMEGPTPVSAQIHAATMVTAGVYLLIRQAPLFEHLSDQHQIIQTIGGQGSLLASLVGLFEMDIKKVIAYSTLSQLGYMMVAIGMYQYSLALFHLINHAFFKALLFQAAGSLLHAFNDHQDQRKLGMVVTRLPLTSISIQIGSQSLMAFPFLTGFYSKDQIIEQQLIPQNITFTFVYIQVTQTAQQTGLYSLRAIIMASLFSPQNSSKLNSYIQDSNFPVLFILVLGSIFQGYITQDFYLNLGTEGLMTSNHILSLNQYFYFDIVKFIPLFFQINLITQYPLKANKTLNQKPVNINFIEINNLKTSLPQKVRIQRFMETSNNLQHWSMNSYVKSSIFHFRYMDKGLFHHQGPYGLPMYQTQLWYKQSFINSRYFFTTSLLLIISSLIIFFTPLSIGIILLLSI